MMRKQLMKQSATLLLVVTLVSLAFIWRAMPHALSPGPHLEAPSETVDLGAVVAGETAHGAIPIRNGGNELLSIRAAYGECGCTTVSVPKMTLGPGERTTIDVTFNSRGYTRDVTKQVTILSDAAEGPLSVVRFHVYVSFAAALDRQSVDLTEASYGSVGPTSFVTILRDPASASGGDAVELLGVPADVQAILDPVWHHEGAIMTRRLALRLSPVRAPRPYDESMAVRVGAATLPLGLQYVVSPLLHAQPAVGLIQTSKDHQIDIDLAGPAVANVRASDRDGKLSAVVTRAGGHLALIVRPILQTIRPDGDYDVVAVSYESRDGQRKESLEVPVRILP